ncbi:MAG: HTH-type transcriptional regulator PgrR [Paracidovorax wautersii]|uniref:HTH-type transcriptional regulator PgrR n=1 Tax=Paracidovorax wautersii TaxID=1177982 RepID=A0A7V8FNP0_9BURK|nr:MAG: HTH-type transcriptional regulator PgrR [Paracidovorax wautersii]
MDRFQEMQVFVRVAERGSFTQAADDLLMPRATVTNLIKRLERRLGARLLERTTRTVRLTPDGTAFLARCVRLLADLDEAEGSLRHAAPRGLLRVNLQGTLARTFVTPALPGFLARYPGVRLFMGEDDRLVDLVREGVDCVLRGGALQDSSLVARRLALLDQVTVASPDYLARHGEPASLDELRDPAAGHRAVNFVSSAHGRVVPLAFTNPAGRPVAAPPTEIVLPDAVTVSGADLYTAAALSGLGIVQVPRYRVESALALGQLHTILPHLPPPPLPISALYPHSRQLSPRVQAFVGWLAEVFATVR